MKELKPDKPRLRIDKKSNENIIYSKLIKNCNPIKIEK